MHRVTSTITIKIARAEEFLIKLLDYCEMHCSMCGQLAQGHRRARLSFLSLNLAFASAELHGKRVYLWGGEPMLHPEIIDIIRLFKAKGALVGINTNGHAIEPQIEQIVALRLDRLIFSLDGVDAATHDQIRRSKGSFDTVLRSIRLLRGLTSGCSEPLIRINFVVLPQNYHQIPRFIELCHDLGVYKLHLQLPMFFSENSLLKHSAFLRSQLEITVRNYAAFVNDYSEIDFDELHTTMLAVAAHHMPFAQFYPYPKLSRDGLRMYFTGTTPFLGCVCDVLHEKLAVDSSGALVTCPDFPDVSFGTIFDGVTKPEHLLWIRKRMAHVPPLPACSRCCHYVPRI